jgi:glycosyltransferase involved in cell wall biosynthesis
MKGVAFIRNSDVRYDTRLRKAVYESIKSEFTPYVYGWLRGGESKPDKIQKINGENVYVDYYSLKSKFGGGFKNIFRLIAFNIWLFLSIFKNRKNIEVMYVCDLDVAFPCVLLKIIFNKKIIYDIFDFYSHTHEMPKIFKKYVEKIEYKICKISDVVIVCTEKRAKQLNIVTKIEPVIIYNTPNLIFRSDSMYSREIKNEGKIIVVYVGTLPKTGRLLFEITEKIKESFYVELHVAGSGPLDAYFKDVSNKFSNIFFYGQITNEEALDLQSKADILFATYNPELEINRNSAPNKVYEAMALAKPIIVCLDTDADNVVTVNECGQAINYDADMFMEVVLSYKNDYLLRKKHGDNGYELYMSTYSWASCSERLSNLFGSICVN